MPVESVQEDYPTARVERFLTFYIQITLASQDAHNKVKLEFVCGKAMSQWEPSRQFVRGVQRKEIWTFARGVGESPQTVQVASMTKNVESGCHSSSQRLCQTTSGAKGWKRRRYVSFSHGSRKGVLVVVAAVAEIAIGGRFEETFDSNSGSV